MSYINDTTVLASGVSGGVSFSTGKDWTNFIGGSFHVIWSGLPTDTGTFLVQGSNDGVNYDSMTASPVTMVGTASNQGVNLQYFGFTKAKITYAANSNTTGAVTVIATRKTTV